MVVPLEQHRDMLLRLDAVLDMLTTLMDGGGDNPPEPSSASAAQAALQQAESLWRIIIEQTRDSVSDALRKAQFITLACVY